MSRTSNPADLREATVADASAIADLAAQLGYSVTADEIIDRLNHLPSESETVVVALVDSKVCAWMQVGVALSIESAPFVEIRGLVVDETFRSSGIGSQLVVFATKWALTKNVATLRVRSNSLRTDTHAFYQRRGFDVSKQQKVFTLHLGPYQQRVTSTN